MNIILGTSWKTSLLGYAAAVAQLLVPLFLAGTPITLTTLMTAIGTALLGRAAKDADQTGWGR